jgi:type II secretory pathway predicted ATPase ExeA
MYESHFGLKSRPFGSKAEGNAVFVGPGQLDIIKGLHSGLLVQDAIVTVSGPVGCGKTTVVNRGLATMSPGRMAAWVGRMKLSPEETLELLLAGFGFKRQTNSTLQRFAAFRRLMNDRAAAGVPVAIVVEDARKLGAAVLAEIEALTASDTADGGGANIILMGDQGLNDLLADPELARLKQRIRRRLQVRPLSEMETTGYLKHTIRAAGGNYDALFEQGVASIVHACSGGMPRMINLLCESAMTAAMDAGETRVSAQLMHEVAANNFGYDGPPAPSAISLQSAPEPAARPVPEPAAALPVEEPLQAPVAAQVEVPVEAPVEAQELPQLDHAALLPGIREEDIPETARNLVVEYGRYPEEPPASQELGADDSAVQAAAPAAAAEETPELCSVHDDEPTLTDVPDLINDTHPQLDALSDAVSELLAVGADEDPEATAVADDSEDDEVFDLDAALSPEVESTNLMPGITPNLDEIVAADGADRRTGTDRRAEPPPAFNLEDLPTLSEAMRVDINQEVEQAEAALDPAAAIPGTPVSGTSAPESSEPEPVAKTDDVIDSVLRTEFEIDPNIEFEDTWVAQDSAAADESPGEPAQERPVAHDPRPEPFFEQDPALDPDRQLRAEAEAPQAPGAQSATESSAEPTLDDAPDNAPLMHGPAVHGADLDSDLDALENALRAAKSGDLGALTMSTSEHSITQGDDSASAAAEAEISIDQVLAEQAAQTRKLEEFALAIEAASSLEEVDDPMAETISTDEFAAIADSVFAEGQLVDPSADDSPDSSIAADGAAIVASNDDAVGHDEASVANSTPPQARPQPSESELRQSVAMRIEMLKKMKSKAANERTPVVERREADARARQLRGPQPEPIERQINTSMTQTLEALKVAQTADAVAAEKAGKKSGGLFARFRRSS